MDKSKIEYIENVNIVDMSDKGKGVGKDKEGNQRQREEASRR